MSCADGAEIIMEAPCRSCCRCPAPGALAIVPEAAGAWGPGSSGRRRQGHPVPEGCRRPWRHTQQKRAARPAELQNTCDFSRMAVGCSSGSGCWGRPCPKVQEGLSSPSASGAPYWDGLHLPTQHQPGHLHPLGGHAAAAARRDSGGIPIPMGCSVPSSVPPQLPSPTPPAPLAQSLSASNTARAAMAQQLSDEMVAEFREAFSLFGEAPGRRGEACGEASEYFWRWPAPSK